MPERPEKGSFTTTADFDRWVKNVWNVVEGIRPNHGFGRQVAEHYGGSLVGQHDPSAAGTNDYRSIYHSVEESHRRYFAEPTRHGTPPSRCFTTLL